MGKAATRATTAKTKTTKTTAATLPAAAAAAEADIVRMKRKKKKGRPSLADLQKREQKTLANSNSTPSRRSTRRNPTNYNSASSEFVNDDYDDDDDERKEKKVKLVVRLPPTNQQHFQNSSSQNSGSGSDSEADEAEDQEASLKKRKIDAVDCRSNDIDQEEKGSKAMDTLQGSPLESGPTTPLPDKKLLVFILDRLQKKDTYGVFSEPVDRNELPDYHEIIEQPMDFGTLRKKLDGGNYLSLEELEADIFLICSNAMQYNAPDTVYFRQARSIQELAKRDFENLRHEGDDGEPQPKVVRRGRPPSKNLKRPVENSPVDRVAAEAASGATLASAEDKGNGSNSYNLRKGAQFPRYRSNDGFATPFRPRNGENYSEWLVDWNSEFPAPILRADMKHGKKHFSMIDENRRDTYKQFHPSASGNGLSFLSNASGDMKQFIPVGLHFEPHGYARSLARYAANLGPVAWKIASQKLKSALPDGIAFGPGWVGEDEAPPPPPLPQPLPAFPEKPRSMDGSASASGHNISRQVGGTSSSSLVGLSSGIIMSPPTEQMIEAVRRFNNSQNEFSDQGVGSGPGSGSTWNNNMPVGSSSFPVQQKPVFHPNDRNGFNNPMFGGYDIGSLLGGGGGGISSRLGGGGGASHSNPQEAESSEEVGVSNKPSPVPPPPPPVPPSYMILPSSQQQRQQQQQLVIPPDLNVRVQTSGSPSGSSLQIGSPPQQQQPPPDLALQL